MARENTAAAVALARKIKEFIDIPNADMRYLRTQTAQKNHEQILRWVDRMSYHERRITQPHERVYLVVSELRLIVASHRKSGSTNWKSSRCRQREGSFLKDEDIESLHSKHWAVEVDGRYYELTRDARGSRFSSSRRIEQCDRQIVARIFIGDTHFEHEALKEIGRNGLNL